MTMAAEVDSQAEGLATDQAARLLEMTLSLVAERWLLGEDRSSTR